MMSFQCRDWERGGVWCWWGGKEETSEKREEKDDTSALQSPISGYEHRTQRRGIFVTAPAQVHQHQKEKRRED